MSKLPNIIEVGPYTFYRVPYHFGQPPSNEWRQIDRKGLFLVRTRKGWEAEGPVLEGVRPNWLTNSPQPTPREAILAHIHHQLQQLQKHFDEAHLQLREALMAVSRSNVCPTCNGEKGSYENAVAHTTYWVACSACDGKGTTE
jgi:hypothetical protein